MKSSKVLFVTLGIVGALLGPTLDAWAKGSSGGSPPQCLLVDSNGKNIRIGPKAIKINGTISVEATSGIDSLGNQDVDFILRLERQGENHYFRLHIFAQLGGLTNEGVVCLALNPNEVSDTGPVHDAVLALHQQIVNGLSIFDQPNLCITDASIQDAEPEDFNKIIPGTTHAGTLANLTIWARPKICQSAP